MQNTKNPISPEVTPNPTLAEEFISFFRAVVAFCAILFTVPGVVFLFSAQPLNVMIIWNAFGLTVSGVAICAYIHWEQKGKAPFSLPYLQLGISYFCVYAFIGFAFSQLSFSLLMIQLIVLAVMGVITALAEKLIKKPVKQ